MIKDSLANAHKYDNLHRNFRMVFEILQSLNMEALQAGHIELDGYYVYMNVDVAKGRKRDEARLESHHRYIDIQLPLDEAETIGVAEVSEMREPDGEYDAERDIVFYKDPINNLTTVQPGEFVIFMPDDAHAPNIDCSDHHRKIVVKVSVKPNNETPAL